MRRLSGPSFVAGHAALLSISVVLVLRIGLIVADAQLANFVIVLTDDLGVGDVGTVCRESIQNVTQCPNTPNFDQLATSNSSVRFDRFYAGSSVCGPSRATILTGRTNRRTCVPANSHAIARSEFTLADAVKARSAKYVTQFVGKWSVRCLLYTSPSPRDRG